MTDLRKQLEDAEVGSVVRYEVDLDTVIHAEVIGCSEIGKCIRIYGNGSKIGMPTLVRYLADGLILRLYIIPPDILAQCKVVQE